MALRARRLLCRFHLHHLKRLSAATWAILELPTVLRGTAESPTLRTAVGYASPKKANVINAAIPLVTGTFGSIRDDCPSSPHDS